MEIEGVPEEWLVSLQPNIPKSLQAESMDQRWGVSAPGTRRASFLTMLYW